MYTNPVQQMMALQAAKVVTPATDYGDPKDMDHAKLKKVAQQFESVFIKQLMDAMDKTVDRTGLMSGGHAEDTFRGMLNQHIADNIANRPGGSGFGLAEAVYRQASTMLKAKQPQVADPLQIGQPETKARKP